ncbi:hypothetical protein ACFPZ0_07855 [Streptomonospora nanhaiensis]|uniref:Uncharacterized protein n=1 Tax=Streptomonospora nanhaiensis TaxID=1323731 RepID=A0A853BGG8_9ACTN|nr:hypothetical protein [Streptomonospora nanhaiensis]MBV2366285.1 hypothetical protein [Streptomonospora nanhaiensis]MBX9387900.1 hypothetical protein [Streptomonospora nanhaiensis]NYI94413.1 hypothetical protein [Streptomonospora nanhaiensis]
MLPVTHLFGHIMALLHATPDAVIAVSDDGTVRICPRSEVAAGEHAVYSRDRMLSEGLVFTPAALEALAARITAKLSDWELVA